MGTRHLICIVADNEFKVANYGQWDGYPSGQGVKILKFLLGKMGPDFRDKVSQVTLITKEEYKQYWVNCGADPNKDIVSVEVSERFKADYPQFHRDCGADILNIIQEKKEPLKVSKSLNFAADSLFCEWAYVIDLDKNVFEVYKGFNKQPLTEEDRFFFLSDVAQKEHRGDDQYYPVKLLKSYSLNDLPTLEQFVKELERSTENEEE